MTMNFNKRPSTQASVGSFLPGASRRRASAPPGVGARVALALSADAVRRLHGAHLSSALFR
jgi:hypothetical protein